MSLYLIDTNVVSELRKRGRMNAGVRQWFADVPSASMFLSVLTIGEIREGIESIRLRDRTQAEATDDWMQRTLTTFGGHILPITQQIANRWGTICPGQRLRDVDGLIAATALEHKMTVVTRNIKDFKRTGATYLNPFT